MVNPLFIEDDDVLSKPGVVRSIYDPTAGTRAMHSIAGDICMSISPPEIVINRVLNGY
jgi:type I restriction enzyme M protein